MNAIRPSTGQISTWLAESEHSPDTRQNAHDQLDEAVQRLEFAAYTRGLRDGLAPLESISLIVPSKGLSAIAVINMAKRGLEAAVGQWAKNKGNR